MYNDYDLIDYMEDSFNEYGFRDLGGHSALRKGKRIHPCPTCNRENMLSQKDKDLGYQCDLCADSAEGIGFAGEY